MSANAATTRPMSGLFVAGVTAAVSGFSIFINSYGVHTVASPAVYTTAKNIVAAIVLFAAFTVARLVRGPESSNALPNNDQSPARHQRLAEVLGFAYVGVIGGGLAFVLFFTGLERTTAVPAAFLHDPLVVFVALVAWPLLGERLSWYNAVAIVLLVIGAVSASGGIAGLTANSGNGLVLLATVLWAIETVVAKKLLRRVQPTTVALVRMGVGASVLVGYLAFKGELSSLGGLDASAIRWVVITGLFLGAYVGTWMTALSRARAIDVTSVLVASAIVTLVLQSVVQHKGLGPEVLGIALMATGTALVAGNWKRVVRA
jgi:drug/metabolite transporter (DMT)-like permease